ncbi:MAG TPA: hypothetical protein PK858_05050, partial [Saprospiraceae bacterium]|nr:hypothetical protein [Saprospiraceae bacterium]
KRRNMDESRPFLSEMGAGQAVTNAEGAPKRRAFCNKQNQLKKPAFLRYASSVAPLRRNRTTQKRDTS